MRSALDAGRAGRGGAWVLEGPGGIGKTRLLHWLEGRAQQEGFEVRWGYCLKGSIAPFFPFEQVFRSSAMLPAGPAPTGAAADAAASGDGVLPPVLIVEEARPSELLRRVSAPGASDRLIITRERPGTLRSKHPGLPPSAELLWLSRAEGEGTVSPNQLDALGERLQHFLARGTGSVVAVGGLEYLVSQNAFLPVLRLVQFLRDAAEASGGHLLLSFPAQAFDARERSLLEAEGEVVRPEGPAGAGGEAAGSAGGGPGSLPPGGAGAPPAPEASSTTLLRYLGSVERLAAARPVAILLDDLQWADSQSLLAFQFLTRAARKLRVVLFAAVREEEREPLGAAHRPAVPDGRTSSEPRGDEEEGASRLPQVVAALRQEGALRSLHLEGLPDADLPSLAGTVLGAPLELPPGPNPLQEFLRRSGGNPFFVLETLRQLQEEGWLVPAGDHYVLREGSPPGEGARDGSPDLPTTIRSLVARRLERLPPDLRAFLQAAAVVGSEFDLAPLAGVLGLAPATVDATARTLAERMRLLDTIEPGRRYAFGHPLMWETTVQGMREEELRARAASTARWWASHRGDDVEAIARLYHDAREGGEGLPWVRRALEKAMREAAVDAMMSCLRWWRDLTGRSEEEVQALVQATYTAAWRMGSQGAFGEAHQIGMAVRDLAQTELQRWTIELGNADLLTERDLARALPVLRHLDQEFQQAGPRVPAALQAHMDVARGTQLLYQGEGEAAVVRLRRAIDLAPPGREGAILRLRSLLFLGHALLQAGRADEVRRLLEPVLRPGGSDDLAAAGAEGLRGGFLTLLGDVELLEGRVPAAVERYEEGYRHLRDLGNIRFATLTLGDVIEGCLEQGDLARVQQLAKEGAELAERFDLPRPARLFLTFRAFAALQAGRFEEVRALTGTATLAASHDPGEEHEGHEDQWETTRLAHLARARALGELGEVEVALHELDHLVEDVERFPTRWRPTVHRYRLRVRARAGDLAGAREDATKGLELARAVGNRLAEAQLLSEEAGLERARGERARADQAERRAKELLRTCGLEKDPWALPPVG